MDVTATRRTRRTDDRSPAHDDLPGSLHALPAAALVVTSAGVVTYVNARAASLFGTRPGSEPRRSAVDVLRPADPVGLKRFLTSATGSLDVTLTDAGGAALPATLHAAPLDSDRASGCVLLVSDLAEARRAQQTLWHRDRLAWLGQIATGMAHEIRNPLTGISASAEVVRNRLDPANPHRPFLDLILDQVTRLTRLVDTFLQYARPSPPRLVLCPITDCLDNVHTLLAERCAAQGVRVEKDMAGDVPPLYIDRDHIVQVLLNVTQNALQAMPDGGTLTLRAHLGERYAAPASRAGRRATDGGSRAPLDDVPPPELVARVQIADTGPGIPSENLPHLFDPFFTSRPDGNGLGLPIALSIVQEHGGAMEVTSPPGGGTTVTIDLPLEKRRGVRPAPGDAQHAAAGTSHSSPQEVRRT